MKKRLKFIALLLCMGMILTCASFAYANDAQASQASSDVDYGYLSEDDVFAALAFTCNNAELTKAIKSTETFSPNGILLDSFDAEAYSKFTDNQYGGMYLNKDGSLVICYTEGSDILKEIEVRLEKSSGKLLSTTKNVLVRSVVIKGVKYSYSNLLNACEQINKQISLTNNIASYWLDVENNRIVINVFEGTENEKLKKDLSMFDQNMFVFFACDKDDVYKPIASINGTSEIGKKEDGNWSNCSRPYH